MLFQVEKKIVFNDHNENIKASKTIYKILGIPFLTITVKPCRSRELFPNTEKEETTTTILKYTEMN